MVKNKSDLNCSGIALIGIIVAIVLMGLLGGSVLMLVTFSSMESLQTMNWSKAFFAAESGISKGKEYIATNASYQANLPWTMTGMIGQASFEIIITTNAASNVVVSSTGVQGDSRWTSKWRPEEIICAMLVYGTRTTAGIPQYRTWDGSAWSSPANALSVGTRDINWVVVKACPKSNEYIAVTLDTARRVNAQVFRNGSWSNLQAIARVRNADYRGMDIAYETLSGDAMVVAADGDADPVYYVWDGTAWTGPTRLNITRPGAGRVNWVKLASDPVSDEIIALVQDDNQYYTAQVWNGNAWGNEQLPSVQSPNMQYESMAVEYETSGNQAIIISANGTSSSFRWSSWNGTTWSAEGTRPIGDDFYWGTLVNNPNSDNLLLTYIDTDNYIGKVFWNGSSWTTYTEIDTSGNSDVDRCVQGQFETISGHEGHAIVPYSDTSRGRSRHSTAPSGSSWDAEISVSTIRDSATVQTRRTEDGKILALFFDDVNSRYDFSCWDGSSWSTRQTLENDPSVTASPYKEPFMMAPRLWFLP